MARGIIGGLEGDSGVELVRTCKMAVGSTFGSSMTSRSCSQVRREDAERVFQRWGDLVIKGQVIFMGRYGDKYGVIW